MRRCPAGSPLDRDRQYLVRLVWDPVDVPDLAGYYANREWVAAVIYILMGPVANVLRALGRGPLGICACSGADEQTKQRTNQQQCFAKTE